MKHVYFILLAVLLLAMPCSITGQNNSWNATNGGDVYERYVQKYHSLAVEQMERYKIPASITLAQGLLESAAGTSELSRKANNHFGIKADKSWNGAKKRRKGSWYRSYGSVRDSYEDHSKFLAYKERYASLFRLNSSDYKGWAKGLRKAGYAEDRSYPQKLINLIERYQLYKFDSYSSRKSTASSINNISSSSYSSSRTMYRANGLIYIIGKSGDTFKTLAKETGVSRRKLIRYNDLYKNYTIKQGDIIYLEKKNSKAEKPYKFHTTTAGESLYSIAQKYGIRLKKLLNMNPQFKSYATLKVGDIVRLR